MKQAIKVQFRDKVYDVLTCLTAEQAEQLRSQWEGGTVILERIGDTPLLLTQGHRSWLVRTVCRLAGVERDWEQVDAECAGRTERYPRPRRRERELPSLQMPAPTAREVAPRAGRLERTRRVQPRRA